MRTHPDSVWLRTIDVDHARESEWTTDAVVTHSETWVNSDEVEFVPAAAYRELKAQLIEAWSAGYVAGQECSKDGVPRRNPFSVAEKGGE